MRSIKQELISKKLIWKNEESKWCKSCPVCFKIQSYSSYEICREKIRVNIKCNSCAKSGKNNPLYGKHLSNDHKKKLQISMTGFKRGPCPTDRRKKISETKKKKPTATGSNQFKRKPYIFPDSRIEWVQGYEPWTLNYLLNESVQPNDIIIKGDNRPVINYSYGGYDDNRYLPDCYISSSNTLVETKSTWTWNSQKDRNVAKISGSVQSGYNIRVIVWDAYQNVKSDITYRA